MKYLFILSTCIYLFTSCNSSVSFKKNASNGLTTSGHNLSCEEANIFINDEPFNENEIVYGEDVSFKFMGINGFKSENGMVFPGMKVVITNSKGEEIVKFDDLYDDKKSLPDNNELILTANLTFAKPLVSGEKYKAEILIWDKKSDGTFKTNYAFSLIENPVIEITTSNLEYQEVYLFSEDKTVTDNVISNSTINYIIFEGLSGFNSKNEIAYPGLNLIVSDSKGNVLIEEEDLLEAYNGSGLKEDELSNQLRASFNLNDYDFNLSGQNIHIYIMVWDKEVGSGEAFLEINADCEVK
ncbi:MAG: hypothetical protein V4622_14515 [Bacteroidota bacterium]